MTCWGAGWLLILLILLYWPMIFFFPAGGESYTLPLISRQAAYRPRRGPGCHWGKRMFVYFIISYFTKGHISTENG